MFNNRTVELAGLSLQQLVYPSITFSGIFQVLLSSDSNGVASLDASKCSVYITDEGSVTGLIFPVDPVVVSLKDYDNVDTASTYVNGYPLICVTVSLPMYNISLS